MFFLKLCQTEKPLKRDQGEKNFENSSASRRKALPRNATWQPAQFQLGHWN